MNGVVPRLLEHLRRLGADPVVRADGTLEYDRERVSKILQRQVDQREAEIVALLDALTPPNSLWREWHAEQMAEVLGEIEEIDAEIEERRQRTQRKNSTACVELPADRRLWPRDAQAAFWTLVKWLNATARETGRAIEGKAPHALEDAERATRETWRTARVLEATG